MGVNSYDKDKTKSKFQKIENDSRGIFGKLQLSNNVPFIFINFHPYLFISVLHRIVEYLIIFPSNIFIYVYKAYERSKWMVRSTIPTNA